MESLVDGAPMVTLFGASQTRAAHLTNQFRHQAEAQWALSSTWHCVVKAASVLSPPQRFIFLRWVGASAISVSPMPRMRLSLIHI